VISKGRFDERNIYIARIEEVRNTYTLIEKPLGRRRHRWKDHIVMEFGLRHEDMD
jgi:hypothetical protein